MPTSINIGPNTTSTGPPESTPSVERSVPRACKLGIYLGLPDTTLMIGPEMGSIRKTEIPTLTITLVSSTKTGTVNHTGSVNLLFTLNGLTRCTGLRGTLDPSMIRFPCSLMETSSSTVTPRRTPSTT